MAPDSFKYLKEHRKKRQVEAKKMRSLSDEELAAIATNEEEFLPTPYKRKIPKKMGRPSLTKNWLEQNGITPGTVDIDLRTIRYALWHSGLTIIKIENLIKEILRPNYDSRHGYYRLKIEFFLPFVDDTKIVKFGNRIIMTRTYAKLFKEEYDAAFKKEKEDKKTAQKV